MMATAGAARWITRGVSPVSLGALTGTRSLSGQAHLRDKRYHINYHLLKEGGLLGTGADFVENVSKIAPTTVTGNVKNVQGWRGGAERGFLATYPDCIHQITQPVMPPLVDWYTKVLTHNLASSVLGTRFGMLVPITYHQLSSRMGKNTKDNMRLAHVLGWSTELVRAANLVAGETLSMNHDTSTNHFSTLSKAFEQAVADGATPTKEAGKDGWATKHHLGNRAFNDALLLEHAAISLVQKNFQHMECYNHLLDTLLDAFRISTLGRALVMKINQNPDRMDLSKYDVGTYKRLVNSNITHTNFVTPVCLALHFAGLTQDKVTQQASQILTEIGYMAEVTSDFANCFYDPDGTDIQDGRLTWLIINAYQRANAEQRKVLEECYGVNDPESVAKVKRVYEKLKMRKMASITIEESRSGLLNTIQQLSTLAGAGLSPKFFFTLLDNMEVSHI